MKRLSQRRVGDTLLDFRRVAMQFPNGTVALGNRLTNERGEFVTVVRPSGAANPPCCESPSSKPPPGTAEVDTKRIGYVFQDACCFPGARCRTTMELLTPNSAG
jgi:NitT/TauT family transport system ATP-binding protein